MFSNIMTTQLLKTCVIVPKIANNDIRPVDLDPSDPDYGHKLNIVKSNQAMKHRQNTSLFQRGIMNFEDYNYDLFNKHILVDSSHIFQPDSSSSRRDSKLTLTSTIGGHKSKEARSNAQDGAHGKDEEDAS